MHPSAWTVDGITHAFEVLRINMSLRNDPLDLLLNIRVAAALDQHHHHKTKKKKTTRFNSLKVLPPINVIPSVLAILVLANVFLHIHALLSRDTAPGQNPRQRLVQE